MRNLIVIVDFVINSRKDRRQKFICIYETETQNYIKDKNMKCLSYFFYNVIIRIYD